MTLDDIVQAVLDTHLGLVDFWPGTTKWKTRTFPAHSGYGLSKLLLILNTTFTS